jgi:D-sedoheptulose 7-phosphate isomerase
MKNVVDALIAVPSTETPRIQECHILVGHALCDAVEQAVTVSDGSLPRSESVAD